MAKTKTQPDAPAGETPAAAQPVSSAPGDKDTLTVIKEWVRREILLAANGASEAEREAMNP